MADPARDDRKQTSSNDLKAPSVPGLEQLTVGSPEYCRVVASAFHLLLSSEDSLLPASTYQALNSLGLAEVQEGGRSANGKTVTSTVTSAGEIFGKVFKAITYQAQEYTIASLVIAQERQLKLEIKALAHHIETLSKESSSVARELRKLIYELLSLERQASTRLDRKWFAGRLREALSDIYTIGYVNSMSSTTAPPLSEKARNWLQSMQEGQGGIHDYPAWPEDAQARELLSRNAQIIFKRALSHSGTFWRLSGETMRLPGLPGVDALPLIARFGLAGFDECSLIHNTSADVPPGRGIYFNGAQEEKLFFADQRYKSAFHHFGSAKEDFGELSLGLLRGGYVIGGVGPRWDLRIDDKLVKYAVFIPNDHLDGRYEHMYGIPVSRCRDLVRARFDVDEGVTPSTANLADSSFFGSAFAAQRGHPPTLTLSNISTVFGGLCQAYPFGAGSLFGWERTPPTATLYWHDAKDRVHYGWMLRNISSYDRVIDDWLKKISGKK